MARSRRVLEIGYGGYPMGNTANGDISKFAREMPPDTMYHGIDFPDRKDGKTGILSNGIKQVEVADAEANYRRYAPERVFLHRMDGRKLGFRAGVFDEVHLHDIIHDPRVSQQDVRSMFSESYRVLGHGGLLIVTGMEGRIFEASIVIAALAMEEAGFKGRSGVDLYDATGFGRQIEQGYGRMPWFTIIAEKSL